MSGFNAGVVISWLGPVVTNSATSEEETHQGTATDVEANIPSQERTDSTSTQSTIWVAVILGIIYATFFLGFLLWLSWLTWWIYPAQAIWQRKVWQSDVCQGWDYEIIMDTISYRQLGLEETSGEPVLSNATLFSSTGPSLLMDLQHPAPNISLVTLHSNGFTPEVTVQYNYTSFTYSASSNLSGLFNNTPVLYFPGLSASSLYPNYPWTHQCSAPTVAMIDSNGGEIVRTAIVNYDDCTQLKLCGMNGLERLVITVGAIFIEMEKAGLCCTNPYKYILLKNCLTAAFV
jgi:hypothetical protein